MNKYRSDIRFPWKIKLVSRVMGNLPARFEEHLIRMRDKAATESMLVNRVGDFGLAPGISGRFTLFQIVDFSTIFARASARRNYWISCNMRFNGITLICILLLIGAVEKTA
ncbi:unnamed protein product [Lupinus luteus]|uniref:Uncharacterized protein n=1 Tax=Lupinus luteus TaxID=3873 RepID=A0AAV1Y3M2_LUPLU